MNFASQGYRMGRHFGGTKLGAGGLVRAYAEAARQCLRHGERALRRPMATIVVQVNLSHFNVRQALVLQTSSICCSFCAVTSPRHSMGRPISAAALFAI